MVLMRRKKTYNIAFAFPAAQRREPSSLVSKQRQERLEGLIAKLSSC
jgi:hypothetical protein